VLYRLNELPPPGAPTYVFVPEGEKDADTLVALDLVATTAPFGAGEGDVKWNAHYATYLADRRVVVLADNDPKGRTFAARVATSLRGVAAAVKMVLLPGLGEGEDVSDWLRDGHTREELLDLVRAAPPWEPPRGGDAPEGGPWPPTFTAPPRAIAAPLRPVPSLDQALLPTPLRAWLLDISVRGCFPLEYAAAAALVALAAVVGRKVGIKPKRHDDWLVVLNLWGALVGLPGVHKSPAVEEALRLPRQCQRGGAGPEGLAPEGQ
jgi:hypothetical protein